MLGINYMYTHLRVTIVGLFRLSNFLVGHNECVFWVVVFLLTICREMTKY